MKLYITLKPIHSVCLVFIKCRNCLNSAREILQENGAENIFIDDDKIYFSCENLSQIILSLNKENLKIDKMEKI